MGIRENDPDTTDLFLDGSDQSYNFTKIMTEEELEELGREISNNSHLLYLELCQGALDDHKLSIFFQGLTRSSSLEKLYLHSNDLSVEGVRHMEPFLHNAHNLIDLDLDHNDLYSEGFNTLLRALCDSHVEELHCIGCEIESIEIDSKYIPKQLKKLWLQSNIINADGCRGLAKLLQGEGATLEQLDVDDNEIDDHGVEILVDALQTNTSLNTLSVFCNNDISYQGQIMLLKLVNNISSIKATLQSNHTLSYIHLSEHGNFYNRYYDEP